MAEVKWIKIVTDIFDDEKMCLIESLPSADSIIVIWFKLLCLAGKNNNSGVFLMNDRIAYTDEMLATVFRRDVYTVRLALDTFERFGMIEIIDGVITIPNWNKHQTLDSYEKRKERDRIYQAERRAKQKALVQKSTDASTDASTDSSSDVGFSDIDKDIDKEKDINILSSKVEDVISYLNQKTGKCFRASTKGTQKHIKARLEEGYSLEDFYRVIDIKCKQWLSDQKMSAYLRPETLFAPGHFEAYLNEAPRKVKKQEPKVDPEEEARQKAWEEGFHDA